MDNNDDCLFHNICKAIMRGACTLKNIDGGECHHPLVKGLKIWCTAKINSSNHIIAIISRCSECGKIRGIVDGDKEPIPYRADSLELSAKELKKIPDSVCERCVRAEGRVYGGTALRHATA